MESRKNMNPVQEQSTSGANQSCTRLPGPNHPNHPFLKLQQIIGNQAVLRLLDKNVKEIEPGSVHPVHPHSAPSINPIRVYQPVVMRSGTPRYTPEQRRAMREGRVTGTQDDLAIATANHMEPGDIIFRLGSRSLARMINEPVTHGGIYIGQGLAHDAVGFGNRTARLTDYYAEADDRNVVRVVRFIGPQSALILQRLIANIRARNFRMPTDPVPFNLFSSADDYRTATCLEYAHAQYLHAINELSLDTNISTTIRQELLNTYFQPGARVQRNLITARTLSEESTSDTSWLGEPGGAAAMAGASLAPTFYTRLLTVGADSMADDIDPAMFSSRWEGQSTSELRRRGSYTEITHRESLNVFTYSSFVNSTQFFRVVQ